MDREQHIISYYESISRASVAMLAAARRKDWNGVLAAERDCALVIEKLKGLGNLCPNDPTLRQRKLEIIRQLLARDAEVRYLTEPWLHRLDSYLGRGASAKR